MRGRILAALAGVLLLLLTSSLATAQGGVLVNGVATGSETPQALLTCSILDSTGATVTQVHLSNSYPAVTGYWASFGGGAAWSTAKVTIASRMTGLPEVSQVQSYKQTSPYGGWTVTPFAITYWGGSAPQGTGTLKVKTDLGDACAVPFTILQ